MNELIKQLAKQATTIEYGVDNGFDRVTVDQEKLAELIVRECVEKCKTDWYGDSLDDICVQMLKHFGVE